MTKRKIILSIAISISASMVSAQMDVPPAGFNPRAMISEEVGITSIGIKYSRPGIKGREGKIWGGVVSNGFSAFNFLSFQPKSPWRAGANEATTISVEHDVKIEGKNLKAGTYALFMAIETDSMLLIFSKQTNAWGSFYYKEADDVLRVKVKPTTLQIPVEWLKYEFIGHTENSCVIALQWEKLSIPFKIEVDVDGIVLARMREEFMGVKSFISANNLQASMYWFEKNKNLDEALRWAQKAVTGRPFGQSGFDSYQNLASGYEKLNQTSKADSVIDDGLAIASINQYLNYNTSLIKQKRGDRAVRIMLAAKVKFGDMYALNDALSHAYSSKGDYSKALDFATKALKQAPDDKARQLINKNIQSLTKGQDIN